MLKIFEMEYCKLVRTPMIIGCKLSMEDESKEVNHTMYRSMFGNLLYMTTSRPYILQEVGLVSRFKATQKESHVQEVKSIFRYLKGNLDFILWYSRSEYFTLTICTNADWKVALMIKKVQVEEHISWETIYYHG